MSDNPQLNNSHNSRGEVCEACAFYQIKQRTEALRELFPAERCSYHGISVMPMDRCGKWRERAESTSRA
jgi:hypothetical protein